MNARASRTVVIATRNAGKLREFRTLLAACAFQAIGLDELQIRADYEETGDSFAANARLKALGYSRETELPVLGDDSGLEVEILGGRPGIHSARYAGPAATDSDRIRKLLQEIEGSSASPEARFVCALALARQGRLLAEAEGRCTGLIAREPRGAYGFGYDPIFLFPALGKTYAELTEEEKNRYSHRARAVRALFEKLGGAI